MTRRKKRNVECGREAGYVLSVLYTHRTHRILFEMAEPLLTHGCPPVFVHYFYGYLSYIAFFDVAFLCHIRSAGWLPGWLALFKPFLPTNVRLNNKKRATMIVDRALDEVNNSRLCMGSK